MTEPTRDQRRSRRKHPTRARTVSPRALTKKALAEGRALYPVVDHEHPRSRSECAGGPRPCPLVACKFHLYLDVDRGNGAIKFNFPDLAPEDLTESCALDVADRGGASLEDVGALVNMTRERVRQVEAKSRRRMKLATALREHDDDVRPVVRRHLPVLPPQMEAPMPPKKAPRLPPAAHDVDMFDRVEIHRPARLDETPSVMFPTRKALPPVPVAAPDSKGLFRFLRARGHASQDRVLLWLAVRGFTKAQALDLLEAHVEAAWLEECTTGGPGGLRITYTVLTDEDA